MPYPGFFLPLSVLIVGFILRGIRLARVKKKQEEEKDYNRSIRNFVIQHEYVEDPEFWNRAILRIAHQNDDTVYHVMNEMGLADSRFKVPHTIVRRFGDLLTDVDIRRLQETYGYPIKDEPFRYMYHK